MSIFPVTYSLLAEEPLLEHIQKNYKSLQPVSLQFFLRGMNDTYIITTNQLKYIFRVYRADRRNEDQVNFELELLNDLQQNGVDVSVPISRNDGSYINTFVVPEGSKIGVMFSFAEGEEQPIRTIEDSQRFGKSVATIHNVTSGFRSVYARMELDIEYLIKQPLCVLKTYLRNRPNDFELLVKIAAQLEEKVLSASEQGLDWGLCHGDLHGNTNVAFTADGKLTHYDFDICGYGWRAYDIAEFRLAREIHSGHNQEEVERLWEAFLNGYQEIRPLGYRDIQLVPTFVAIRQLWLFSLCFKEAHLIGSADFDDYFINGKLEFFKKFEIS